MSYHAIVAFAVMLAWGTCAYSQRQTVALIHAHVVDVRAGSVAADQTVLIADGKIDAVERTRAGQIPSGAHVVNALGGYLIPGLWDMHVHSNGDRRALQLMLAAGITGVRDMGGDIHKLAAARQQVYSGGWSGPRVIFAGPLLDGPPGESSSETWILRTPREARDAVASLSALHVDFIKVHDRLARDVYYAIAAQAKKEHLPFAGHVISSINPMEASDAGQASIEHFEFVPKHCLPLLDQMVAGQRPSLSECSHSSFDALLKHIAKNGTWLDPTVQSFRYFAPNQWKQILTNFSELGSQIREAHVRVLSGSDWSTYLENKGARPGWCLHDELKIWVDAGFSPLEALQAATLNPAIFLRLADSFGSIKRGYNADLVLLKDNPLSDISNTTHILLVIARGKIVGRGTADAKS